MMPISASAQSGFLSTAPAAYCEAPPHEGTGTTKMDKRCVCAALVAAALCVPLSGCDTRSTSPGGGYGSAGVPARYSTDTPGEHGAEADDSGADEARQAKSEFEDAAAELRSAVRALSDTPWRDQMHTIRSRLDDAEEALQHLESLRPSDPAVQNARDEVDRMRSHMDRLSHENWRGVRPDLETTSSSIEDEASSVVEADDD
jgi:hypothetical protein